MPKLRDLYDEEVISNLTQPYTPEDVVDENGEEVKDPFSTYPTYKVPEVAKGVPFSQVFGWKVKTIEGNNIEQIHQALTEARDEKEKPFLIIGKTIMGKGAVTESGDSFEGQVSTHGMPLGSAGASLSRSITQISTFSFEEIPTARRFPSGERSGKTV